MYNKGNLEEAFKLINGISSVLLHGDHHSLDILTSGTTVATDGTDYIFAGASGADKPTLQFIGATDVTNAYSVSSLTADGIDNARAYGSIDVGYRAQAEVTNGLHINDGELDLTQGPGSVVTLDGTSSINNGGTLSDQAGGAHFGAGIVVNGTINVGVSGSNTLNIDSVDGLGGTGIIRQTGKNDLTEIPGSNSGLHFDVRNGELFIGSSYGHFETAPLGPQAIKVLYLVLQPKRL